MIDEKPENEEAINRATGVYLTYMALNLPPPQVAHLNSTMEELINLARDAEKWHSSEKTKWIKCSQDDLWKLIEVWEMWTDHDVTLEEILKLNQQIKERDYSNPDGILPACRPEITEKFDLSKKYEEVFRQTDFSVPKFQRKK